MKATIRLIGRAIKDGSIYQPLRHLAATTATKAPPKDYHKQIAEIFTAITTKWWRYVYDPQGAEMVVTTGPRIFDMVLGSGKSNHRGFGDCDDITAASGALLRSIGMDVRIATTSPPNSPYIFTHVFLQTKPPRARKWVTFDPVVYPAHGLGYMAPHQRIALWDLDGRQIAKRGKFPPRFDSIMALYGTDPGPNATKHPTGKIGDNNQMYGNTLTQKAPNYFDFADYGTQMGYFGTVDIDENNPAQMQRLQDDSVLADFSKDGILGFGCYADVMGVTTGDQVPHIMAEYDETDELGTTGLVRTKHFEMSPDDYQVMAEHGQPMVGALALADDGEVYRWTMDNQNGIGFFKKLFKKAKKGIKRIAKGVKKVAKKLVTKLPFGKTLWKIGSKIHKTAMKIVKPLLKKLGPIAKRIAPIAAFVPGIGPAISGALMLTGKVYDIAKKAGMKLDSKGKPQPRSKKEARLFSKMLAKAGRGMGKKRAARVLAKYKKQRRNRRRCKCPGVRGYEGLGDLLSDYSVSSYWLAPENPNVGWF